MAEPSMLCSQDGMKADDQQFSDAHACALWAVCYHHICVGGVACRSRTKGFAVETYVRSFKKATWGRVVRLSWAWRERAYVEVLAKKAVLSGCCCCCCCCCFKRCRSAEARGCACAAGRLSSTFHLHHNAISIIRIYCNCCHEPLSFEGTMQLSEC